MLCFLLACLAIMGLLGLAHSSAGEKSWCVEWEVMQLSSLVVTFPVLLDPYSLSFISAVSTIALAVLLFSSSYMSLDPSFLRFHLLVLSFVASMLLLIICPNLVSMLLGWDGLGVTSYLLVIYFQSQKSYGAGMITALSNRVGDVLILISIASLAWWGSWSFWYSCPGESWGAIVLLLVLAASTKSAQIPFSAWLPAAMAAPTPVSSLVHSSTLVTAGVYLIFRLGPSLKEMHSLSLVFILGLFTMLLASMSAMYETDMKKIVALSTLSQLGLMFTSLGLGVFKVAFFHLLMHAFFKAMLFMSVGNMIHLSSDYQDLRKISMCGSSIPVSLSFSLVANMSLMGMPFLSGFYSKDMMLETMSSMMYPLLSWALYYLAVTLTALYSARFMYLVAWSYPQCSTVLTGEDNDHLMHYSSYILFPLACMGGAMLNHIILPSPLVIVMPLEVKNMTLSLILLGATFAYMCPSVGEKFRGVMWSWGSLWGLPYVSSMINMPSLGCGSSLRLKDLGWGKHLIVSPVMSLPYPQESPPSSTSSYLFMLTLAVCMSGAVLLYLCMMNLIISFKFKSWYANTHTQMENHKRPTYD